VVRAGDGQGDGSVGRRSRRRTSIAVAITIRPEHPGALIETASVLADQADYNPSNDTATTARVVNAPAGQGQPGSAASTLTGRVLSFDARGNVTLRVSCTASAAGGCPDALALYGSGGTLPRLSLAASP